SLTLAHPEQRDELGWRLQGWLRSTDLFNSSASVSADRSVATPANNQYATPATGWGLNAALRGSLDWLDWEVGADARFARGNSREQFSFSQTTRQFTQGRVSGGKTSVAGLYAEGASRFDNWFLTLGVRADRWSSSDGHLIQTVFATDATTTTLYPSKHGIVPTARAGVRYDASEAFYLRSAAYAGFRAPTLNELYRPFRVGNVTTSASRPDAGEILRCRTGRGRHDGRFLVGRRHLLQPASCRHYQRHAQQQSQHLAAPQCGQHQRAGCRGECEISRWRRSVVACRVRSHRRPCERLASRTDTALDGDGRVRCDAAGSDHAFGGSALREQTVLRRSEHV